MAHITLSIPDVVYKEMKQHPEIKWSEVARQSIIEKAAFLKKSIHCKDFFKLLSPEAQETIKNLDERKAKELYLQMKKKEWKRAKYLIQA